jgi:hypothetical protein
MSVARVHMGFVFQDESFESKEQTDLYKAV